MNYDFRLTEEIARWAFEIRIRNSTKWYIAFSNPTAGPWKRVEAKNAKGIRGEVYRFPRDDDRPDLILVSDPLESVIILEAKDSLPKLMVEGQMRKSSAVIKDLAQILSSLKDNPYWGKRSKYQIIPGLLWGSDSPSDEKSIKGCVSEYIRELDRIKAKISSRIVAVEVEKNDADDALKSSVFFYECGASGCLKIDCDLFGE